MVVIVTYKVCWHPREETVMYVQHSWGPGEEAFLDEVVVIIWFVYLHNKNPREVWFSQGRF